MRIEERGGGQCVCLHIDVYIRITVHTLYSCVRVFVCVYAYSACMWIFTGIGIYCK